MHAAKAAATAIATIASTTAIAAAATATNLVSADLPRHFLKLI